MPVNPYESTASTQLGGNSDTRFPFIPLAVYAILLTWLWFWPVKLGELGVGSDGKLFSTTMAWSLTLISFVTLGFFMMSVEISFRAKPFRWVTYLVVATATLSILPTLFLGLAICMLWFWNVH